MKFSAMFLLFASAVSFCKLEARVEDHFKKAEGKSDVHSMKGIDFIYMINLDQRPEKFAKCTEQLYPYGIYPYRFSAVNGWELTLEDINDVGLAFTSQMEGGFWGTSYLPGRNWEPDHELIHEVGRVYFCHCMARGTIGIVLSHLSVLQDAYDSGYETIWVMEDDIEVVSNPQVLSDLIAELDKRVGKDRWDILFTDQDIRNSEGSYVPAYGAAKRPNFHPAKPNNYLIKRAISGRRFKRIGARFGAHSMIIRRQGMKKILDFIKEYKVFLPYDMDFYLPEGIRLYTVRDDVVTNQVKALSDNGRPNYLSNN